MFDAALLCADLSYTFAVDLTGCPPFVKKVRISWTWTHQDREIDFSYIIEEYHNVRVEGRPQWIIECQGIKSQKKFQFNIPTLRESCELIRQHYDK